MVHIFSALNGKLGWSKMVGTGWEQELFQRDLNKTYLLSDWCEPAINLLSDNHQAALL
ncbi:MAG: hypothetical protein HOO86_00990 [Bacteroidales bacterium]|nr:hypothetical protein [Bacteroidales bacterium]